MSINKKKVATSATAIGLAALLLLGGSFAWQSISQTALNEASDVINPGGRLHDDFNGENKDVYVENFAEDPIYARIRLDEYFRIVQNKGSDAETVHEIAGTMDMDTGEITSWETHYFDTANATDEYWEWLTGGSTTYMPTFNKDKDSLVADINGTYNGLDGVVTDDATDDRYQDYVVFVAGDSVTQDAVYDADTNNIDDGNVTNVSEEHTATETLGATLMSMQEWIDAGSPVGEYWVYDTDGWVYWAQAIEPNTATGLLLDGIGLTQVMDDSWYYAINVIAQFITADDLGKSDNTGFYADGETVSDDALTLLETIGVDTTGDSSDDDSGDDSGDEYINTIDIYHDGSDEISGGEWLVFSADVYDENGDYIAGTDDVTFSLADQNGNPVGESGISTLSSGIITSTYMEDNNLFVADDIMNSDISELVVTAEYTDESNGSYYSNAYTLSVEGKDSPLQFSMLRNGNSFAHLNETTYQVFTYAPLDELFDFNVTLNGGVADVKWTFDEGYKYTVSEEIDGFVYALSNEDWNSIESGVKIAKINTSTGEVNMLIDEEIEMSIYLNVNATTVDGVYSRTEDLFIRRLYVSAYLYETQYSNEVLKPHESVYTEGQVNTFNLTADLTVDGESIPQADLSDKLTNWKLYTGEYYVDENSVEIDPAEYSIVNNNDGTWTVTISENITEDYLLVYAEYDYGKPVFEASDGIFDMSYRIVESEFATTEQTVDSVVIENEYAEEYAVYTAGERTKVKLYATPYAGTDPVYNGKFYWNLTDAEGNSVSNAYLVYDENDSFNAEVWILGDTADVIKIVASYEAENGGLECVDSYYIYEVNSVPTE